MKLMCLAALGYALISICLWPSKVAALIVNGTIDDQLGDSVTHRLADYYPTQNAWNNQTCVGCYIHPDTTEAFRNTYTAATYNPSTGPIGINIQFMGTAIYVFFILASFAYAGALEGILTLNSANFTLDSNEPVLFSSEVSGFHYDVLVFSQTMLSNTLHTLNISTSGPLGPIYVDFDYAIYTYDEDVSITASPLSSLSAVTATSQSSLSKVATMSQAPSTTVASTPARRTPVGAIVGGIAGGIALLALVIFLGFCWRRRRSHAPELLITQLNDEGGSLAVSASGMPYTQPLAVHTKSSIPPVTVSGNNDNQASMPNSYRTLHSGGVVLSDPPSSQQLPSSPLLPSPLNVNGTREEVRRARQQDLDNRLRVVQHNIVQLEESNARPGRSVSLRQQTSGAAEIIEEEMHMSMPDIQEAIRSMREQIGVLRRQQQSPWAQGLSDDPLPGYTMEASS